MKPRKHQERILKELYGKKQLGLFMGTGTGKTVTSLFKHKELGSKKLLVLAPPTVLAQWKKEIKAVMGESYKILEIPKSYTGKKIAKRIHETDPRDYDAIVLKYGILPSVKEVLKKRLTYDFTFIADESHRFKDFTTQTAEIMHELKYYTDKKIILTATPTEGKDGGYIDYFSQLSFLGILGRFNEESQFKEQFCILEKRKFSKIPYPVKIITGYKNIDYLQNMIKKNCRYYEGKRGDYDPQHIKVEFPKPKNYKRLLESDNFGGLDVSDPTRLRVAMKTMTSGFVYGRDKEKKKTWVKDNHQKLMFLKEFFQDVEGKVVIFYQYNIELAVLQKFLEKIGKKYKVIRGKVKNKYEIVQDGDFEVLLGQFNSLSESIDGLQYQTNISIFYTMPESSITYRQAIGRIDRDGQRKVPTYYYLVSKGTIDEAIYDFTSSKKKFTTDDLENYAIQQRTNARTSSPTYTTRTYY